MNRNIKACVTTALAATLAACSHTTALREEIGQIETRIGAIETEIAQGVAEIGAPGKDIRTRVAYRPMQQWAANFGTKTATFRQTGRSGDLAGQDNVCKLVHNGGLSWTWRKDPGYRVWIHEDKSTKVDFTLGPLAVAPTDQGLRFNAKVDAWAKTQIAGAGRAPCVGGWSPTVTVGAEGRTRPATVLELRLSQPAGLQPSYELAVVSPRKLDVEFRTGMQLPFFGDVDVKRTFEIDNFARTLASGEFDLLVEKEGQIVLPGGETRVYRLSTINPAIRTSLAGMTFETDIDLQRDAK